MSEQKSESFEKLTLENALKSNRWRSLALNKQSKLSQCQFIDKEWICNKVWHVT